ncbi:MAG: hypothetical protein RTU92_00965 [Candidatus Thorarchaeota archaeon]
MKKEVVITLIFMVSVFTSTSLIQPPYPEHVIAIDVEDEWQLQLEGATNSCDIVECSSGGYAALCMNRTFNGLVLFRINSNGSIRWIKDIQSTIPMFGNALVECESGGFAILATRHNYRRMYIIRTDADGVPLWTSSFTDGFRYYGDVAVKRMAFDFVEYSEGFSVVGSHLITRDNSSWTQSFLVLLNESAGRVRGALWYSGGLRTSIEKTDDGFIVAMSYGYNSRSKCSVWTKLNFDGQYIWSGRYEANPNYETVKIVPCSTGGFAIAGKTYGRNVDNTKGLFGTIDDSGEMKSLLAFGGNRFEQFFDLDETPDGGFILVGESNSFTNESLPDAIVMKVDTDGHFSWGRTLLPERVRGRLSKVVSTVDGDIILCGDFWNYADGSPTPWMFKIVDIPPESPLAVTVTDVSSPWTPPSSWTWTTTWTTTWSTTTWYGYHGPYRPPYNWWSSFLARVGYFGFVVVVLSLPIIQTLLQRREKSKLIEAKTAQDYLVDDKSEDWS